VSCPCLRRRHEEQSTLFGNHEEQEAINEVQKLSIEPGFVEFAAFEPGPQRVIVGMAEKPRTEYFERRPHPIAQPIAHPAAFLDPLLIPGLEQAFVRLEPVRRQP
jgi:hypothetical protein